MDFNSILKVIRLFDSKQQMIDIIQDWQQSKHPRGKGGKFAPSGGASNNGKSDNFDAFKAGKPIGGLSPQDYKREKLDPDFNDPDWIKKGIEFNKKQAHARGLALRQMVKNPSSAKNYAYLWIDGQDGIPEQAQDGGAGSGNFGHKGRAGKRGGSSKRGQGGGAQHIKRQAMSAAKKADNDKFRKVVSRALGRLPVGTYLSSGKQDDTENIWYKGGDGLWRTSDGKDGYSDQQMAEKTRFDKQQSFYRVSTSGQKQQYDDDRKAYEGASKVRQRVKKLRQAAKDWKSKVPQEVLDHPLVGHMVNDYTPDQALGKNASYQNAYFKAMADALGWQDVKKDGHYDLLSKEQKDALLMIQNKAFGLITSDQDDIYKQLGRQRKDYSTEENFLKRCSSKIRNIYDQLMAKALAVQIQAPDLKSSNILNYLMQHPDYKMFEKLPQKPGYRHTAGSQASKRIKDKIKTHDAFKGIPDDKKQILDSIVKKIDVMDDDVLPYVQKCLQNLHAEWVPVLDGSDGGGNCHYSHGVITIGLSDSSGYERDPQQTANAFWHEFGHFFDEYGKKDQVVADVDISYQGMIFDTKGVTNLAKHKAAYNKAGKKDLELILAGMGCDKAKPFSSIGSAGTMVTQNGMQCVDLGRSMDLGSLFWKYAQETCITQMTGQEWQIANGAPKRPKWQDYMESYYTPKRHIYRVKQRYKGAQQAYRQASEKYSQDMDKFYESMGGFDKQYDMFNEQQSKYNKQYDQLADLCDLVAQMSLGTILPVAHGTHSVDYYRKHNSPVQTSAQVFRYLATGRQFTLQCMQKMMPNVYQLMIDSIKFGGQY